jgi:hypothetical protein
VKNFKLLQHFLACFKFFTLKTEKWWKHHKFFTYVFSDKSVKNNGNFSPILSLKNLKCSTSESPMPRKFWGTIQPLTGFSIGQGPSRYLGVKWRAMIAQLQFHFQLYSFPCCFSKEVKILKSWILNLEMADKQAFEASVFLLSFRPRFAVSENLVSY